MVITLRLWSASASERSTSTPGTLSMATAILLTFSRSRPSEKFGTHSITALRS